MLNGKPKASSAVASSVWFGDFILCEGSTDMRQQSKPTATSRERQKRKGKEHLHHAWHE
jgi:hypothetical protein